MRIIPNIAISALSTHPSTKYSEFWDPKKLRKLSMKFIFITSFHSSSGVSALALRIQSIVYINIKFCPIKVNRYEFILPAQVWWIKMKIKYETINSAKHFLLEFITVTGFSLLSLKYIL